MILTLEKTNEYNHMYYKDIEQSELCKDCSIFVAIPKDYNTIYTLQYLCKQEDYFDGKIDGKIDGYIWLSIEGNKYPVDSQLQFSLNVVGVMGKEFALQKALKHKYIVHYVDDNDFYTILRDFIKFKYL